MNLFEVFKKNLKTQTFKDTVIVVFGQAVFTLISALFFIIVARQLGPEELGIYSTVVALVLIITDTLDVAFNSTIIKFINQKDKLSFLKFAFLLKIGLGCFFIILIFLTKNFISFLLQKNLNEPLKVAAFLILIIFLYRFPKAVFQGQKKFKLDALMDVFSSFLRLILVFLFIKFFQLKVTLVLLIQIISAFLLVIWGLRLVSFDFLKVTINSNVKKKFFSFQGWLAIGFILASIHSRLDNFLLMRLAGSSMVGFYQAGYRFFLPVLQFASVLSTVFAPRFASFRTDAEVKKYLKKSAILTGTLAILICFLIPLLPILIKIFYGEVYQPAIFPSQILTVGYAFFIFAVPFISCLIYRLEKTKFFAFLNLIQFFLIIVFNLILIPKLAASGAALATTLVIFLINSLAIFWVIK